MNIMCRREQLHDRCEFCHFGANTWHSVQVPIVRASLQVCVGALFVEALSRVGSAIVGVLAAAVQVVTQLLP